MGQAAKLLPKHEREAIDRDAPVPLREGEAGAVIAAEHFAAVAAELSDGVAIVRFGVLVWANDRLVALTGRSSLQEFQGSGETEADALENCLQKIKNFEIEDLFPKKE